MKRVACLTLLVLSLTTLHAGSDFALPEDSPTSSASKHVSRELPAMDADWELPEIGGLLPTVPRLLDFPATGDDEEALPTMGNPPPPPRGKDKTATFKPAFTGVRKPLTRSGPTGDTSIHFHKESIKEETKEIPAVTMISRPDYEDTPKTIARATPIPAYQPRGNAGPWEVDIPPPQVTFSNHGKAMMEARRGSPEAALECGINYLRGRGIPVNIREASFWLKRAADKGSPEAFAWLGIAYHEQGKYSNALHQFSEAVERGSPRGMLWLARYKDKGLACKQDPQESNESLKKVPEQLLVPVN